MHGVDQLKIDIKDISRTVGKQEFNVGDAFFQGLDQDEIKGGDVSVSLAAREVAGDIFRLEFRFEGMVQVLCDRCLEPVEIDVEGEDELRLCYEDNELSAELEDSDVVILSPRATDYNFAWELYEMIALALPMQRVHQPGGCNDEMLAQINMADEEYEAEIED